jgi:acetyl-CoA C-acetyltransferase
MDAYMIDAQGTTCGSLIRQVNADVRLDHVRHADHSSGAVDGAAGLLPAKAGSMPDDIDLFEISEAFALAAEQFVRDPKLGRDEVRVNGGAIASGHPVDASGSILIGTLLAEWERRECRPGPATMCAAGGMASAIIVEGV